MKQPSKPCVPKKVYKSSILLYTIVDYHWISPGDPKLMLILKPGWLPVKVYNYEHPVMKEKLNKLRKQSEQSLRNKEVDWDRLSRMYITI